VNQLFTEVLAFEHALKGINGVVQPFGNGFAVFQFSGSNP